MFFETNYIEQDSTKNHLTSEKTIRVSKYTFPAQMSLAFIVAF